MALSRFFSPLFWHPLRGFKCRKLAKFDFVSDLILYFHYFQPVLPLVNIYIFIFFCSTPSCSGFNLCAMGDCSADMTRHTYSHIFVVPASELPFHPAERKPSQLAYKTLTSAKVGLKWWVWGVWGSQRAWGTVQKCSRCCCAKTPTENTQFGNCLGRDYTELQSSLNDTPNSDWMENY